MSSADSKNSFGVRSLNQDDMSRTTVQRWQAVPLGWKILLILLGVVIAAHLFSSYFASAVGSGSRRSFGHASSFDASPTGTEAMAQLLSMNEHSVTSLTTPLASANISKPATVFILDPTNWSNSDSQSARNLLQNGDELVFAGAPANTKELSSLLRTDNVPEWSSSPVGTSVTARGVQSSLIPNATSVVSLGHGSWKTRSGLQMLTASSHSILGLTKRIGNGRLILLASASPLENANLTRGDNAAFALDLARESSSPVYFDEYNHGVVMSGTGLAGLPASWRWGLGLAILAALVWLVSASRRFGPIEPDARELIPSRAQYVEAVATLLAAKPDEQLGDGLASLCYATRERMNSLYSGFKKFNDDDSVQDKSIEWPGRADLFSIANRMPRTRAEVLELGKAFAQLQKGRDQI